MFDHPTIDAIATYLEHVLLAERGGSGTRPDTASGRDASSLDGAAARATDAQAIAELSDGEVEALLLQKLAEIQ